MDKREPFTLSADGIIVAHDLLCCQIMDNAALFSPLKSEIF
jgi:hypothetical protein